MKSQLINLTGHVVHVADRHSGQTIELLPVSEPLRVEYNYDGFSTNNNVVAGKYGGDQDPTCVSVAPMLCIRFTRPLPIPIHGEIYVVSQLVAALLRSPNFVYPVFIPGGDDSRAAFLGHYPTACFGDDDRAEFADEKIEEVLQAHGLDSDYPDNSPLEEGVLAVYRSLLNIAHD